MTGLKVGSWRKFCLLFALVEACSGFVGPAALFPSTHHRASTVSSGNLPVLRPLAASLRMARDSAESVQTAFGEQGQQDAGRDPAAPLLGDEHAGDGGAAQVDGIPGDEGRDAGVLPASFDKSVLGKCSIVFPEHMPVEPQAPGEATKPLLLYVPGFDGTTMFAEPQFADLSRNFELRALLVPGDDRLTAEGLVSAIDSFVQAWHQESPCKDKPILLGESCGGMLSLAVSIRSPQSLNSIVLVNPATSYRDTTWPLVGRLLSLIPDVTSLGSRRLPTLLDALNLKAPLEQRGLLPDRSLGDLAFAGAAAPLMALRMFDQGQFLKYGEMARDMAVGLAQDAQRGKAPEKAEGMAKQAVEALEYLFSIMPPETVKHRLKVLEDGSRMVEGRMGGAEVPCLVIAGDDDNVLPSKDESKRLSKEMPNCAVMAVKGGHLLLDGGGVNVTKAVMSSRTVSPISSRKNPVDAWTPPSKEEIRNATESLGTLRRLTSPVFFSTDAESGNVEQGLRSLSAALPGDGPVLFVGNHQLLALDLGVLLDGVYQETGTLLRGLAHPMLFDSENGGVPGATGGGVSGNMYESFGAVPVSGRNFAKLLQKGESVLLFPGGLSEALHRKDEYYTLKWPEKTDFVRLAARYNATIVPFGGVGASDAASVLLDPEEAKEFGESPLGKLLSQVAPGGVGRQAQAAEEEPSGGDGGAADRLAFKDIPIVVPKAPWQMSRIYFMFGRPISTAGLNVRDAEQCAGVYERVQGDVDGILGYLQDNRGKDPYKEFAARVLYETQFARSAPTFSPPPLGEDGR